MSVKIETDSFAGPSSYPTGGFVITTGLSIVDFLNVEVAIPGANLPHCAFVVTRNSPAPGQATVKVMRSVYDDLAAVGAVTGLPAGVTARTASDGTYDAEAAHTHGMAHDHAAVASGDQTGAAGGSTIDLTSPVSISSHTHSFDPPSFTGNTGAGSSHTHTLNNIYQHGHTANSTATDAAFSELPNGTDLSGATLIYKGVGPA